MAQLEIFDGTNWITLGGQTNIALTGAVVGSGSSNISTSLNMTQNMSGLSLGVNWSNNGSFAEYSIYHYLQDSNPPPQFVETIQAGTYAANTYRWWNLIFQPGFSSSPSGNFQIDFVHNVSGRQTPFKITSIGSGFTTYLSSTLDMGGNQINNLPLPTLSNQPATKGYVDSLITTQLQNLSNIVTTGTLKANNLSTYNVGAIVVSSPFNMSNNSINNAYSLTANYKITSSESSYQIYMRSSSTYLDLRGAYVRNYKTSAIIETNAYNETASLVMNGDYIQSIQTFDDLGFIFTDEDTDPQSSWQSYISSSGSLVTSSSKKKKHSIRKKEHKNYLERLNKLNIYSYALKIPILDNDNEKTKTRKYFKNKQLHLGLLSEEVEELFDNCTDNFKTIEFDKSNKKEIKESIKVYIPKVDEQEYIKIKNQKKGDIIGIKYDSLLCYTILAIQELSKKVESLEKGAN
jgi:hypothetical protein